MQKEYVIQFYKAIHKLLSDLSFDRQYSLKRLEMQKIQSNVLGLHSALQIAPIPKFTALQYFI